MLSENEEIAQNIIDKVFEEISDSACLEGEDLQEIEEVEEVYSVELEDQNEDESFQKECSTISDEKEEETQEIVINFEETAVLETAEEMEEPVAEEIKKYSEQKK